MVKELIPDLLSCKDCRQLNQVLRKAGVHGVMFRTMKKTSTEPRRTYEVLVINKQDCEYKRIYASPSLRECIYMLGIY